MMMVRTLLCLALPLALCACGVPQKFDQLKTDKARFDQQQHERAAYTGCNKNAMPGTTQHLTCRMAASPK